MQGKPEDLDRYELLILAALQKDARLSTQDLADEVGLSSSATWRRVKSLEDCGLVQGYVAVVDAERLGFSECVFAHVKLERQDRDAVREFESCVLRRAEVLECFATAGEWDYILRIVARSKLDYHQFLQDVLFGCPVVARVQSSVTMKRVKFTVALPIVEPR